MRWLVLSSFLAIGCGRIGFGETSPGATDGAIDTGNGSGDALIDTGNDPPAACLSDQTYVAVGGLTSKYKQVGVDLSWLAAKAACEADGAYLPILDDQNEANHQIIGDWVGLTDVDVEGEWRTVKGEPAPFEPWQPGQPSDGTAENCARLDDTLNQMESRACTDQRDYSCECS